jgi:sugar (pentulose or hexulose) kinase
MSYFLIFDIGKTNKKWLLFDEHLRHLAEHVERFEEITDEDGFPAENLPAVEAWVTAQLIKVENTVGQPPTGVNFSTYGATMVHLNGAGRPLGLPLNYLKPLPGVIENQFLAQYGPAHEFALATSSPFMGMLNSGLQLYHYKYSRPRVFSQIKTSLHLPQYLSYLLQGQAVSEPTSLGCHTGLWNFAAGTYANWVATEGLTALLPPLANRVSSVKPINSNQTVGLGLHDSSASLLPYTQAGLSEFVLLSTGTWSIGLNPTNHKALTPELLAADCLHFLSSDFTPVLASRLFLGKAYEEGSLRIKEHYGINTSDLTAYKYSLKEISEGLRVLTGDTGIDSLTKVKTGESSLVPVPKANEIYQQPDARSAYLLLNLYLAAAQVKSLSYILLQTTKKIIVSGGFCQNKLFLTILANYYTERSVYTSEMPHASALGAATLLLPKTNRQAILTRIVTESLKLV